VLTLSTLWIASHARAASGDATAADAMPVSSECPLFAAGNPQPWSITPVTLAGGAVELTPGEAALKVTFNQPNGGGGVLPRPYPKAGQWLTDPASYAEVDFDAATPDLPRNLQIKLRLQASPGSKDKRLIASEWKAVSQAVAQPDGTRRLRFKLSPAESFGPDEIIIGGCVVSREPGSIVVRRLSLQKLRNVAVQVTGDYRTYLNRLELTGATLDPAASVTVQIVDAAGKTHAKQVTAKDGHFSLTWDAPDLGRAAADVRPIQHALRPRRRRQRPAECRRPGVGVRLSDRYAKSLAESERHADRVGRARQRGEALHRLRNRLRPRHYHARAG